MNCPHCHQPILKGKDKRAMLDLIQTGRDMGLTIRQIAESIGRHPSTVEKYCYTYGIRKKSVTKPVEPREDFGHAAG